jgi:hypothetical protein
MHGNLTPHRYDDCGTILAAAEKMQGKGEDFSNPWCERYQRRRDEHGKDEKV